MGSNTADSVDRFDVHGPKHITNVSWDNEEHRRCIAACLVKGVTVYEKERAAAMDRTEKLAQAWWESFDFGLRKELTEQISFSISDIISNTTYGAIADTIYDAIFHRAISDTIYGAIFHRAISDTIYGAIFEYVPSPGARPHPCAPRYVVAFRGTMLGHPDKMVAAKDLLLDANIVANTHKNRTRYKLARGAVEELMVGQTPAPKRCLDVWLVGYSLGASLALDVGRDMMVQGLNLPTFLFNPPQVSLTPLLNLLNATEEAKWDLHFTSFILKVAVGYFSDSRRDHMEEVFNKLSPWVPNLYVNENDSISQGFIDYLELRQKYRERFPDAGTVWMKMSYRDLVRHLLVDNKKEQPHLLPSATLWKSRLQSDEHRLQQWWKPDSELGLGSTSYRYTVPEA